MIINSILDSDLYKFTMQQAVLNQFPQIFVEYKFKCRMEGIDFSDCFDTIKNEIMNLKHLKLSEKEEQYLKNIPYFKPNYIQYLKNFKFNLDHVYMSLNPNGEINLRIKGLWVETILFEVHILSIISEVYSKSQDINFNNGIDKLSNKIDMIQNTEQYNIPIQFIGIGETLEDMAPFNAEAFIEALCS